MSQTNGTDVDLDRIVHGLHLDITGMASRLADKDRSENAQIKMMLATIGKYIGAQLKPLQKQIEELKKQVAELQAGGVKFSGNYQRGNEYRRGELCAFDNSIWCAVADVKAMEIPGTCTAWQLTLRGQPHPRQPTARRTP